MIVLASWNCNRLSNKAVLLENLIVDIKIDCLFVSETWQLGENVDSSYQWPAGFNVEVLGRSAGKGGGVAWLIKKGLKVVDRRGGVNNEVEWLALKVVLQKKLEVWLVGCYVPKGEVRWDSSFVDDILDDGEVVLVGDLNARGPSLPYCKPFNSSGREVAKIIASHRLVLAGPWKPTHVKGGTLDLVFTSQQLVGKVDEVDVGDTYGSDHNVVITKLGLGKPPADLRYDFNRGKWSLFQSIICSKLKAVYIPDVATPEVVDMMSNHVVEVILAASKAAIPQVPACKVGSWRSNKDISEALRERHRYHRLRVSTGLPLFGFLANKAKEKYNRLVKEAEEKALRGELASLERSKRCNLRKFFAILDRLSGDKRQRKSVRTITAGNIRANTDSSKADVLLEHLRKQFVQRQTMTNTTEPNDTDAVVERFIADNQEALKPLPSGPSKCSLAFSKQEVRKAVRNLKLKAPGRDGISNMMLKKGGQPLENFLRRLYNMSLSIGYVPPSWKEALIVPIPRPGKDLGSANGYRPVSLLPVIAKLMESMLATRLSNDLDRLGITPKCQSAFRRAHSTSDQTFKLAQLASLARVRKEVCVAAFIDFEGAFNAVWHDALRMKIAKCNGISSNLCRWLSSFLDNRTFSVRVGDAFSKTAKIEAGVPQGSALSPTLFSLFTADLPETNRIVGEAETLMYADDVTAVGSAVWVGLAVAKVQKKLRRYQRWSETWRLPINPAKCQVMVFGKFNADVRLYINGRVIPKVDSAKYLGLTFDPKLSFKDHFEDITGRVRVRLATLAKVCKHENVSLETRLAIYKSTIRPLMEYSCVAFLGAPKKELQKLQVAQNHALRLCLDINLMDKIPIQRIHDYTKIQMVEDRLRHLAVKFGRRAYNEVAPISDLVYNHRQLRECQHTPLGRIVDKMPHGPRLRF